MTDRLQNSCAMITNSYFAYAVERKSSNSGVVPWYRKDLQWYLIHILYVCVIVVVLFCFTRFDVFIECNFLEHFCQSQKHCCFYERIAKKNMFLCRCDNFDLWWLCIYTFWSQLRSGELKHVQVYDGGSLVRSFNILRFWCLSPKKMPNNVVMQQNLIVLYYQLDEYNQALLSTV